jgi:hypothetical protein
MKYPPAKMTGIPIRIGTSSGILASLFIPHATYTLASVLQFLVGNICRPTEFPFGIKSQTQRGNRKMKYLISAAVLAAFVTGAAAQTSFYVVQDVKTKKCTIVDKKPTTSETVVVGDGAVFKTRTEAETGMKSVKVCTSN